MLNMYIKNLTHIRPKLNNIRQTTKYKHIISIKPNKLLTKTKHTIKLTIYCL